MVNITKSLCSSNVCPMDHESLPQLFFCASQISERIVASGLADCVQNAVLILHFVICFKELSTLKFASVAFLIALNSSLRICNLNCTECFSNFDKNQLIVKLAIWLLTKILPQHSIDKFYGKTYTLKNFGLILKQDGMAPNHHRQLRNDSVIFQCVPVRCGYFIYMRFHFLATMLLFCSAGNQSGSHFHIYQWTYTTSMEKWGPFGISQGGQSQVRPHFLCFLSISECPLPKSWFKNCFN